MSAPSSTWSAEENWLPLAPEEAPTSRLSSAEEVVCSLGFSPSTRFHVEALDEHLVEVRPCIPGTLTASPTAPLYLVGPDDRVFIVPALPGTVVTAAMEVLSARYGRPDPVSEEEHSRLETLIEQRARELLY